MRAASYTVNRRGFVLITMAATMFILLAAIGLAFDGGRIYIARNEAQVFVDAASMLAASKLDGTEAGLKNAREAVAKLPQSWNLSMQDFTNLEIAFSADGVNWQKNPAESKGLQFARVSAPANHVEITFLRAVGGPQNMTVPASASASAYPVRLIE
jgi:uncharacterized membrane protein